jgi:hypothetical protein
LSISSFFGISIWNECRCMYAAFEQGPFCEQKGKCRMWRYQGPDHISYNCIAIGGAK